MVHAPLAPTLDCCRTDTIDSGGLPAAEGAESRLRRSMSGDSGLSGYTATSGGTSRYSKGVVLVSAEEFDATLEGMEMGGRWLGT